MVLAYNEETGEIDYYPITVVWVHEDPVIVYLTIEGETIITTPEHPFYTEEGQWIVAGDLQTADEIRSAAWDTGTVQSVHFVARPQTMYNLTVATAHTYFVGHEKWLVHNNCVTDFLSNVVPSTRPGTRNFIGEISGNGYDLFEDLVDPSTIQWIQSQNRYRGFTSDGFEIGYRPVTSSGTPSIDIYSLYNAGISNWRQVHVVP